jgi:hypothetical protein
MQAVEGPHSRSQPLNQEVGKCVRRPWGRVQALTCKP